MSPVRRSGLSRPTSVIVLPRKVICDGGAGWIERRFGGAATLARTWLYVKQPTINVTAPSTTLRTTLSPGCTSTSCSGCLNSVQRASSSLTQISTPTRTVAMYCKTTLLGTMALPGRRGMTNATTMYAITNTPTACQNGCLR